MPATTDAAAIEQYRQHNNERGLLAGPQFIAHQARFNSEQNESRAPISWSTQSTVDTMIEIPRDADALVVSVAELARIAIARFG
ncbi:MAG: hypothetical protein ACLP3C_00940 [Mycobacterium sp.]|uniref:hypothetical protein n=1 Tax=Mycobacterium sp. TaxID=1785 RepID=UPI003F97C07A